MAVADAGVRQSRGRHVGLHVGDHSSAGPRHGRVVLPGDLGLVQGWWETVALGSCAVGLVAVVVFWIAARGGGETMGTVMWNAFVHVAMVAGVITLLLVPQLERWVDRHVMGG